MSRYAPRRLREACTRRRFDEAGDTLVELLIAMTIIAISVAGLLGGLATDISSSGTHRGITSLDGIVRSFAEEARQIVQLDPTGAQFQPCTTSGPPSYRMISAPYPAIGSATAARSTQVTVFGTGFTPGGSISSVWLEPTSGSHTGGVQASTVAASTPTATYGNTTVNFLVPASVTNGTPYYVAVTDSAALTAISSVPFTPELSTVTRAVNPSPMHLYTLGITAVSYWNGTTFSSTCSPTNGTSADLQQLTISGTAPGENDKYNVVVTKPIPFKGDVNIPIAYAGPASPSVGDTLTYTVTPTGISGYPTCGSSPSPCYAAPTGTLTWYVVPPSGPSASCNTTASSSPTWTLPSAATPTCSFTAKAAGTYGVYARYGGDNNYLMAASQCTSGNNTCNASSVGKGTPTTAVVGTSNGAAYHPTLTFTATVTGAGNTPSGTITWSISQTGNPFATPPTCSPSTLGASGQTTCTITNATPGNYVATATYSGDSNYTAGSPGTSNTVSVPFLIPTITLSDSVSTSQSGSSIIITATVSGPTGDPIPTGSVTWTSKFCSNNTNSLDSSGTSTCTIKNPGSSGYFGTFTYAGDVNYSGASKAVNIPIAAGSFSRGTATLTFSLTITGPLSGPTPGGSVNWVVTTGTLTVPCLAQPTTTAPPNVETFSCQVVGAVSTLSYTASATYSGDSNYLPPYPNPTTIGPVAG